MGKGDKKSKKGKRWKGSYGVSRNKSAIKGRLKRASSKKPAAGAPAAAEAPAKPKRAVKKKSEA
jgi:ribosomal small subunit protein bTHX